LTAIVQVVGLFFPFLLYLLITKQKVRDVLKLAPLNLKMVLMIFVITIMAFPVVMLISYLSTFVFIPMVSEMNLDAYPLWQAILIIGVFPALFEEFIFRGVLQHEYEGVSLKKRALITGLFFGIIHLNFHQSIYAGLFGILYAYLYYYTKTIWAPALWHFLHNSLSVLWVRVAFLQDFSYSIGDNLLTNILIFGGISLIAIPILVFCFKELSAHEQAPEHMLIAEEQESVIIEEKQPTYTWGFWATIGVFIAFAGLIELALRLAPLLESM
jgi:membrane protease YdiL (CAAX protease family)